MESDVRGAPRSALEAVLTLPQESAIHNSHRSGCYAWSYYFEYGSVCWARTSDPLINSQLLYQLS